FLLPRARYPLVNALPGEVALWAKSRRTRRPKAVAGGHSSTGLPRPARSAHPKPVAARAALLQGAVDGFAEQGDVVGAVVEAHDLQRRRVRALEVVEGGRGLAEAPELRQRQPEQPAQQLPVDCVVGHDQQRVVAAEAV